MGDPEEGSPVDGGNMSGTRQAPLLKLDFASAYRQLRAFSGGVSKRANAQLLNCGIASNLSLKNQAFRWR
jgi:hypothetical protein